MENDIKSLKEDISEFEKTLNDGSLDESAKLIISSALNNARKRLEEIQSKPKQNISISKAQNEPIKLNVEKTQSAIKTAVKSEQEPDSTKKNTSVKKKAKKTKRVPNKLSKARDQINKIAREIRKPDEKWNLAVKRASQIYKKQKSGVSSMDNPEKNISKKDVPITKTDIPISKEVKEPSKEKKEEKQKLLPLEKQELGKLVLTEALKQRGITQDHIDTINKTKEGIVLVEYLDVIDNTESKEDDKKRKAMKLGLRVSRHGLIYSERRTNRGDKNPQEQI